MSSVSKANRVVARLFRKMVRLVPVAGLCLTVTGQDLRTIREEIVRREEALSVLRTKLDQSENHRIQGDVERARMLSGMSAVCRAMADACQRMGGRGVRMVAREIGRILKLDPDAPGARRFEADNDKSIEAGKVRIPDRKTMNKFPDFPEAGIITVSRVSGVLFTVSVGDHAVVFSRRVDAPAPLHRRRYRVDSDTFVQVLKEAVLGIPDGSFDPSAGSSGGFGGGGSGIAPVVDPQVLVRDFFAAAGAGFTTSRPGTGTGGVGGPGTPDGKEVFFDDRAGILDVRATLADLDRVEEALAAVLRIGETPENPF